MDKRTLDYCCKKKTNPIRINKEDDGKWVAAIYTQTQNLIAEMAITCQDSASRETLKLGKIQN